MSDNSKIVVVRDTDMGHFAGSNEITFLAKAAFKLFSEVKYGVLPSPDAEHERIEDTDYPAAVMPHDPICGGTMHDIGLWMHF